MDECTDCVKLVVRWASVDEEGFRLCQMGFGGWVRVDGNVAGHADCVKLMVGWGKVDEGADCVKLVPPSVDSATTRVTHRLLVDRETNI